MHFINHIIEPKRLLLAWQSPEKRYRTRYIVAELNATGTDISLTYLPESKDYQEAQNKGFDSYPAFPSANVLHHNVLDAFMRRLPPRTRGDFTPYLEGLRLKPDAKLSDFALLGYSGAKLPSDGFSIIHPFYNVDGACELLLEAAGYRHLQKDNDHPVEIKVGDPASFSKEFNETIQEDAIYISVGQTRIGYVNRGLIPAFRDWMASGRIANAWIEKLNGTPERPTVYIYVEVAGK